jgi:uncharacterized protein YeaO (DUF488 family)
MCMIRLKRIYEPAAPSDGVRVLVERLWPRGVKKIVAHLDQWAKEAAPSGSLRKWFHHDPARWDEFRRRYFQELDQNEERWRPLLTVSLEGRVTLVYSSHDREHNNAVALKEYLDHRRHSHSRHFRRAAA